MELSRLRGSGMSHTHMASQAKQQVNRRRRTCQFLSSRELSVDSLSGLILEFCREKRVVQKHGDR